MFTNILIGIAVVVVLFVVVVALRPGGFRVMRATSISAQPGVVFPLVNDFHNWDVWSPWAKLDPNMKQTFEGPSAGTGAIYSWLGDKKVGEGRMTILESRSDELVRIKLEFLKPFASTNTAEFTFRNQDNQTHVTWTMTGECNFVFKAFGLFMNMDKMVGPDFEKGLAQMKAAAESAR
ncbi:MAG: SRPBCC family protein [Candidatus Sumerlaeaceae bacterium]|nr:SRPBCC family protein [Candidatus Sumerlaeaceae bacterium]